jgi:hypothetical protein
MSRCYISGAGFSKAVANLPVMKEMVSTFTRIREREKALGHKNRVLWGDRLLSYLDYLETEFFRKPCVDTENGQTYETCNFKENLEALVSFIDLNLSGGIRATLVDKQGRRSDFTKHSLFWNYTDLGELRTWIQTYLYLTLIGPVEESFLLRPFIDQLVPEDTLITFNYDLVVETALYNRGLWNPSDGYGIELQGLPRVCESKKFPTLIPLYKLHGSLNWDHSALQLRFFYDNGSPIFPGYLEDERPSLSVKYQGKHAGNWMMPSFIKEFSAPGLLSVWTKAFEAVQRAEEVVVIGYSLPEADSAACLLLGTSGMAGKRLTLVNPEAQSLRARYKLVTGNNQIVSYAELAEYLQREREGTR